MLIKFLATVIVILIPFFGSSQTQEDVDGLKKYAYHLHTGKSSDSVHDIGTGFFIKHNSTSYFVTAKHMLYDSTFPKAIWNGYDRAMIEIPFAGKKFRLITEFDQKHRNVIPIFAESFYIDLVLFEVNTSQVESFINYVSLSDTLENTKIKIGLPVYLIGFPESANGNQIILSSSLCSNLLDKIKGILSSLCMCKAGEEGDSGAPVFAFRKTGSGLTPVLVGIVFGKGRDTVCINQEKFTSANILRQIFPRLK